WPILAGRAQPSLAARRRKAAIAWRDTGHVGRKDPSPKPAAIPSDASHSISVKKAWSAGTSGNIGVSGGSNAGDPPARYRKPAIAWRDTGHVGRKDPSPKPAAIPSDASHVTSAKKALAAGTSGNIVAPVGSHPAGPAARFWEPAMPWRDTGEVGGKDPSPKRAAIPSDASHVTSAQKGLAGGTSGNGPTPVGRHTAGTGPFMSAQAPLWCASQPQAAHCTPSGSPAACHTN